MTENSWQLYSTVEGWQEASAAMDMALAIGLKQAELAVANGATLADAAREAFGRIGEAFVPHCDFGSLDSEPLHTLEDRISRHFQKRYGVKIEI